MTNAAKFLQNKKKNGGPNLDPTSLNQAYKEIFRHFIEPYFLLEIAYGNV